MRALLVGVAAVAHLAPHAHHHHHHRLIVAESTAYSPCSSGSIMADGTRTRWGSVAQNTLRLGTRIRLTRPVSGRRLFTVRDRIGAYSALDIWMPDCSAAIAYGRRVVRFWVVA